MANQIEVIDIDACDESAASSSHGKLLNILTHESSDDDEDIICLDTVFKPVSANNTSYSKSSSDNQCTKTSTVSQKINDLPKEQLPCTPDPLAITDSHANLSTHTESNATNYFSDDEESIDGSLVIATPLEDNARNHPSLSQFMVSENTAKEPPNKRLKSLGFQNGNESTTACETYLLEDYQINRSDCTYPKPKVCLLDLIVVILKNSKCLMFNEIWDYLSGIFPYYEYNFTPQKGMKNIRQVIQKAATFFLITTSDVTKDAQKKLIVLNPISKTSQGLVIRNLLSKRDNIQKCMYCPDMFDALIMGSLSLPTVHLFRLRKRCRSVRRKILKTNTDPGPSGLTPNVQKSFHQSKSSWAGVTETMDLAQTSPVVQLSHLKDVTPANQEEERDQSSPQSSSSTDTVLFDPQITNCRSLNKSDLNMFQEETREGQISKPGNREFHRIASSLLSQIDNHTFSPVIDSGNAFANTVWSSEDAQRPVTQTNIQERIIENPNQEIANVKQDSFPEMEKCIPKWQQIFPWMSWKPWLKKIFCSTCQYIHNAINSSTTVTVMDILHPDDVFKVSKQLRDHSDKTSHKMATVLRHKNIISTLYFLINSHFNEFTSVSDILSALEDLLGKECPISQDLLQCAVSMLGQYLEHRILVSLKAVKRFSVITDPCAGLLIVRWLSEQSESEEHIISSYASVKDKTPYDYLASLGINVKGIVVYITNARCEECVRCSFTKKVPFKNSSPLRLPQIDRYLIFLWRTKLLKPFYSLGSSLCKLWLSFPHKFTEVGKIVSLEKLTKFPSNPDMLIEIFQHFEKFKEICSSIYDLTGNLVALGLLNIDSSKYTWLLDIFPILTDINFLLMEIKTVTPFSSDFDNLCHQTEKLKIFCTDVKESIRAKKFSTSVDGRDVDDVFFIVQMTVKEFQQPIYHKGKSVALAYYRMTVVHNLEQYATNATLHHSYTILTTAMKAHMRYDHTVLLKSLMEFLQEHQRFERKGAAVVLEYLQGNKESAKDHSVVLAFYKLMAYFPFQSAAFERCLYEIKVYDYLFYRTAWASIGDNVKDYLLTIISELNGKRLLSEVEMQMWWKQKNKS